MTASAAALIREHRGEGALKRLTFAQIAGRLGPPWTPKKLANLAHRKLRVVRPPRPWTEAEDATLRRLHAEGRFSPSIGRRLGRSARQVRYRRRALGLPANRRRPRVVAGPTSPSAVGNRLAALRSGWAHAETRPEARVLDALLALAGGGWATLAALAARLGLRPHSRHLWAVLRGLRRRGVAEWRQGDRGGLHGAPPGEYRLAPGVERRGG